MLTDLVGEGRSLRSLAGRSRLTPLTWQVASLGGAHRASPLLGGEESETLAALAGNVITA